MFFWKDEEEAGVGPFLKIVDLLNDNLSTNIVTDINLFYLRFQLIFALGQLYELTELNYLNESTCFFKLTI